MLEDRQEKAKIIFIFLCLVAAVFITLLAKTPVFYSHFFYIPIVFSCIWWKKKGILVALFLSFLYLFTHMMFKVNLADSFVPARPFMFLLIAYLVAKVTEIGAKAEEETKLAYEQIEQIFSTTGDALCVIGEDFSIIKSNNCFLELTGIGEREILMKKCYEVFHIPLCETDQCILKRIVNGEERVECDIEYARPNGGKMFCIITATPFRTSNGTLVGIVVDIKDITERTLAERAMRASEERYRAFMKNFKGITYEMDMFLRPVFFHGAVKAITGYTEADFLSCKPKLVDIVFAEDLPKFHAVLKKLHKEANYSTELEYRIVCKDGKIKWLEEIVQNQGDESGRPILIQGILYDITERKQTEETLQNTKEQLFQAQKMEAIGRLAGGIAHDFNNLTTIIIGNSDLLLDDLDKNNPIRGDLEEIYKAGERAGMLTRQLLAFSRRQMLQAKVLDINNIIMEIEGLIKRLIGEDINFNTIYEPNLARVKADPAQIEQVIMNLAINARDAMPDGGTLTIRTENVLIDEDNCKLIPDGRPGKFICISVEDTGIGIDGEIKDKIFEPFFTTKAQGVGTGLGLSTVYGIIKQHEGLITVYSEPDQGSMFKIYLPAISIEQESRVLEGTSIDTLQGFGERILLVEDEDGVRRFASRVLGKNGYIVFEAGNAMEAMRIFTQEGGNFSFILSDVVLPDKNGIQLIEEIQSKKPTVKAILCSGYSDHKSQWPRISAKKIKFLKKPYNKYELLKALKDLRVSTDDIGGDESP